MPLGKNTVSSDKSMKSRPMSTAIPNPKPASNVVSSGSTKTSTSSSKTRPVSMAVPKSTAVASSSSSKRRPVSTAVKSQSPYTIKPSVVPFGNGGSGTGSGTGKDTESFKSTVTTGKIEERQTNTVYEKKTVSKVDVANINLTTMDLASYIYHISNTTTTQDQLPVTTKKHIPVPDGCWMYILDRSEELPVPSASTPPASRATVIPVKEDDSVTSSSVNRNTNANIDANANNNTLGGLVSSAMFSFRKTNNNKGAARGSNVESELNKTDSFSMNRGDSSNRVNMNIDSTIDSTNNNNSSNNNPNVAVTSHVMPLWYVMLNWDAESVSEWHIECVDRTEYEHRY